MSKSFTFINSGTYGCIYHPSLNCQGNKGSDKYVSKLHKNDEGTKREFEISKKIQKINGYSRYFAPIIKNCRVEIKKKFQAEFDKCDILNNHNNTGENSYDDDDDDDNDDDENNSDNKLMVSNIRYLGDIDFSSYVNDIFIKYPATKAIQLLKNAHEYLLVGCKKLTHAGIIHNDIKGNNIMFDKKANNPIFIDFGLSLFIDELHELKKMLTNMDTNKPDDNNEEIDDDNDTNDDMVDLLDKLSHSFVKFEMYPYWTIDIMIINYIKQNNLYTKKIKSKEINEIVNAFIYGLHSTKKIHNFIFYINKLTKTKSSKSPIETANEFKKEFIKFMSQFSEMYWKDVIIYLVDNKTYTSWNEYAVEVVIFLELYQLIEKGFYLDEVEEELAKYNSRFYDTILSMPNARKLEDMFQ